MVARNKKLTHPSLKAGHSRRCFARLIALFTLLHHHLSLSILPFLLNFLIISLSGSIKEPGIQTRTRWLFWDISLPSFWSAGFLNKVILLALTPCLQDLLAYFAVSRISLDLVTSEYHLFFSLNYFVPTIVPVSF